MAVFTHQRRLMDAITFVSIPLDEPFRKRFGNPYAVVHRGDLHGVLLTACRRNDKIDLKVNSGILGDEQDGTTVTARLSSGVSVSGSDFDRGRGPLAQRAQTGGRRRCPASIRSHQL